MILIIKFCEIQFRCDIGFFGNPLIPGKKCEPCPCYGGPCDQETGRCLECRGNTEGWKCEKCKENHYGNPKELNCLRKYLIITDFCPR